MLPKLLNAETINQFLIILIQKKLLILIDINLSLSILNSKILVFTNYSKMTTFIMVVGKIKNTTEEEFYTSKLVFMKVLLMLVSCKEKEYSFSLLKEVMINSIFIKEKFKMVYHTVKELIYGIMIINMKETSIRAQFKVKET